MLWQTWAIITGGHQLTSPVFVRITFTIPRVKYPKSLHTTVYTRDQSPQVARHESLRAPQSSYKQTKEGKKHPKTEDDHICIEATVQQVSRWAWKHSPSVIICLPMGNGLSGKLIITLQASIILCPGSLLTEKMAIFMPVNDVQNVHWQWVTFKTLDQDLTHWPLPI